MKREAGDGKGSLYEYDTSTVADLLLCLRPHVLREIRDNLVDIEQFFTEGRKKGVSELIQEIEELLISLDGEA